MCILRIWEGRGSHIMAWVRVALKQMNMLVQETVGNHELLV